MCWLTDLFRRKATPNYELPSPMPRLKFEDMEQLPDGRFAVRFPPETIITSVLDTNSMDPTFDAGMIIFLQLNPDIEDLIVGDIIVYEHPELSAIHRISAIGHDSAGWWCKTRASNPLITWDDPVILRKEHVKYLHRGEIY